MKITIDDKQCTRHKLSVQETLILMAMQLGGKLSNVFTNLKNRNILVRKGGHYYIDSEWSDIVKGMMEGNTNDEDRLLELAQKMRECYPEGKMNGTAYYYRCNTREVALKLKKFFAQYGNYPDERIVDAVKKFVAAYNGNYRFLPLLKYFIGKNKLVMDEDGNQHVTEVSLLASFLENEDTEVNSLSDDWLMSARN